MGCRHRPKFARITGLPERTARRVFKDVFDVGLLASEKLRRYRIVETYGLLRGERLS